jgi:hypothetical protein
LVWWFTDGSYILFNCKLIIQKFDVIPKKVGTVEKSRVSRSNESERRQEQDSRVGEGALKVSSLQIGASFVLFMIEPDSMPSGVHFSRRKGDKNEIIGHFSQSPQE